MSAAQHTQARLPSSPPLIGTPWPEQGGIYAGLSRGPAGGPDFHLILSTELPPKPLAWKPACSWATKLSDCGFEDWSLPNRAESALLYANLKADIEAGDWYWTSEQSSAGDAWLQGFYYGVQNTSGKSYEARARAVRRFTAQSFNPSSPADDALGAAASAPTAAAQSKAPSTAPGTPSDPIVAYVAERIAHLMRMATGWHVKANLDPHAPANITNAGCVDMLADQAIALQEFYFFAIRQGQDDEAADIKRRVNEGSDDLRRIAHEIRFAGLNATTTPAPAAAAKTGNAYATAGATAAYGASGMPPATRVTT